MNEIRPREGEGASLASPLRSAYRKISNIADAHFHSFKDYIFVNVRALYLDEPAHGKYSQP